LIQQLTTLWQGWWQGWRQGAAGDRRWALHLSGAALVLILLAACSGGEAPAVEEASTPAVEAAGTAVTDEAADEAAGEQPAEGDAEAAEEAATVAATPAPAGDAAGEAPLVPPPDLAERGPVATITPADRNMMYEAEPPMEIDPAKYYYATLLTEKGEIQVQLFADRAPKTVNNFVYLARQGFYDNTTFHRVLDGFMAQAGDPTGTGAGGPGYEFEDEIYPGLVFDQMGLLAMANRGPGTNGSQFFITFTPTEWLNGNHTIFGKVIEGDEILSQITRRDPDAGDTEPGDEIYTILIEETDSSVLPTPTPSPPTPTPTATPTPFAPTSADAAGQSLAEVPAAERVNYFNTAPEMVIDTANQYTATITTSKGPLVVTLYDDVAPVAVNNFVVLSELGFYDETPISQVQPNDSIVIGSPDNSPPADAGYRFPAELGALENADIGAFSYIPMEQTEDGSILSSSSLLLIALVQPPPQVLAQFPFFAQVVEGVDLLPQLTTSDTIESITITSDGE
jgi:cyclophilin family peptidyl-prolyl cis-trans isomerase